MAFGKTPLHDTKGKLHFPYRALESKVFIIPTPPPIFLGTADKFELFLPEEIRYRYQNGTGTVLSAGPGYFDKKDRWHPTDPGLKPGTLVYYDTTVPWCIYVPGVDGKNYMISLCVEADILAIIEE